MEISRSIYYTVLHMRYISSPISRTLTALLGIVYTVGIPSTCIYFGLLLLLLLLLFQRPLLSDYDWSYFDSVVIALDALQRCLLAQPKQTNEDDAIIIRILLKEVSLFLGEFH